MFFYSAVENWHKNKMKLGAQISTRLKSKIFEDSFNGTIKYRLECFNVKKRARPEFFSIADWGYAKRC